MKIFLQEEYYVDYSSGIIRSKASELFSENMTDLEKAKAAYSFVRDKISYSFDCDAEIITARASECTAA